MKGRNWKAAGLVAIVSVVAPNACHAADAVFAEAASKCIRNRADPERVLSAADAAGWHGLADQLSELEKERVRVNPNVRVKDSDSGQLMLRVGASKRSGEIARSCSVVGMFQSWADALKAAQSYFGVPPSQDQQLQSEKSLDIDQPVQVVQWVYLDRDGQRTYLRGDQLKKVEELTGAGTAYALSLVHSATERPGGANPLGVIYKEVEKAPAP